MPTHTHRERERERESARAREREREPERERKMYVCVCIHINSLTAVLVALSQNSKKASALVYSLYKGTIESTFQDVCLALSRGVVGETIEQVHHTQDPQGNRDVACVSTLKFRV
jgi:hypothetical protein